MRRKLLGVVAFATLLALASHAWAPPPPPPRPTPTPTPPVRPPGTSTRPIPGGSGSSFPTPNAKLAFNQAFSAARAKSAADAAAMLRNQNAALLTRTERAALLNIITYQMLRQQQQAVTLEELRSLRTDWGAVGPGAGLDPILAMELEAAESVAERLVLAELLRLLQDGQFTSANTKLYQLDSPRYLPATVVEELRKLRTELTRVFPFIQARAAIQKDSAVPQPGHPIYSIPPDQLPESAARALRAWEIIANVKSLLETRPLGPDWNFTRYEMNEALRAVELAHGAQLAGKLRVELSARVFLRGHPEEAAKLLEGAVDPVHAAAVLADLRAVVLGRGELKTQHIANLLPADHVSSPPQARTILPPDELARWKPPARTPGETTVDAAVAELKNQLITALDTEVNAITTKINTITDRIRSALVAEGQPQKVFLEKVENMLGWPMNPPERRLALAAGTRGLSVAETVGVLSAQAHRPAAAAKLLCAVPVFTNPVALAVTVELSGRAPAGLALHPDAAFKLTGIRDRARIRDTFSVILHAHAARLAAGQDLPPLERATLEVEAAKRLGLTAPESLTPAECVQALLDVCEDWASDYHQLSFAWNELDEAVKDGEIALMGAANPELQTMLDVMKIRRSGLILDRQYRAKALSVGCQFLGAYGKAAEPAQGWLYRNTLHDEPWRPAASEAYRKITGK